MTQPEAQYLIACAPARPGEPAPLPGWERNNCTLCTQGVWVAATSLGMLAEIPGAKVVCLGCSAILARAAKRTGHPLTIKRAAGADDELRRAGRPDLVISDARFARALGQ